MMLSLQRPKYKSDLKIRRVHINTDEQAENRLAQLIERAVAGEEVILDSNRKSVAKLERL